MSSRNGLPNVGGGLATLAVVLGLRRWRAARRRVGAKQDPFTTTSTAAATITSADAAFLDQALFMALEIHKEEVTSGNAVEAKAGALMSALGVTASLLVAAGTLLFAADEPIGKSERLADAVTVCFLAAAGLLASAFYHGFQALRIGNLARPSPRTFVPLQIESASMPSLEPLIELKRHQLADLLVSHHRNRRANNEKAAHLKAAYAWALGTVISLLVVGILLGVHAIWPTAAGW